MKRLLTSTLLLLGLNACSTIANSDFSDRNEMAAAQGYEMVDEVAFDNYGQSHSVKTMGAVTLSKFSREDANYDPTVFTIKRERQRVYAETSMYTSDNKDKTFIDDALFNVGMNKREKGFSAEMTLKF